MNVVAPCQMASFSTGNTLHGGKSLAAIEESSSRTNLRRTNIVYKGRVAQLAVLPDCCARPYGWGHFVRAKPYEGTRVA